MKKLIILSTLLMTSAAYALTDKEIQNKGIDILQGLVNGHNRAFGEGNLLKAPLDLSVWNPAFAAMRNFVTTIINENASFLFGTKDSTLTNALAAVTEEEMNLVNAIKISRGLLNSPAGLAKQVEIFTTIVNNMIAVQKTLTINSSSIAKNEAQKILKNSALFIETTAAKAKKDIMNQPK